MLGRPESGGSLTMLILKGEAGFVPGTQILSLSLREIQGEEQREEVLVVSAHNRTSKPYSVSA